MKSVLNQSQQKKTALVLGLFLVYLVVYWRRLLINGTLPIDGDFVRLVYPSWVVGKNMLKDGFYLLWDPYRNMGIPFLASPPNQGLYPLRFISYFVNFLDYIRLHVVFHTLLMSSFTFLLFWRRKKNLPAALLGAVAMAFNGFVLARVSVTVDYATIAWIPALIFFLESKNPVGMAVSLALQWMAGYPPFFGLSYIFLLVYVLSMTNRKSLFICLLKGTGLGLGLAAVQILPFLELVHLSSRPITLPIQTVLEYSLHPLELLRQLLIPAPFVNMLDPIDVGDQAVTGFYFGPFLLGLFIFGVIKGGKRERILSAAVVAGMILSLGKYNGFYKYLSYLMFFRFPPQWFLISVFSFMLVAIHGAQLIKSDKIKYALLAMVALDLLIFSIPIRTVWGNMEFLTKAPQRLAIAETVSKNRRIFHPRTSTMPTHPRSLGSAADWSILFREMRPSIGVGYGLYEAWSRHNLPTKRQLAFKIRLDQAPLGSSLFNISGIEKIISVTHLKSKTPTPHWDDIVVSNNPNAYPRVFMTGEGSATLHNFQPGKIKFQVSQAGQVVVNEAFYPGWKATINNEPIKIDSYENIFMAMDIKNPDSIVELSYDPMSFKIGLFISIFSLGLLLWKPLILKLK